jgi:hypothetical protein
MRDLNQHRQQTTEDGKVLNEQIPARCSSTEIAESACRRFTHCAFVGDCAKNSTKQGGPTGA